uniref:Tetratricopeptide-like helical domain-containing protein n=1 Tax=Tanacetum cinerariifolium TaxID=118510 RepID=A0A6L2KK13_TANCI|nr:tetratricopeptide-like helical domain-containing protein [Tanacetum cinerariifolium]
MNNMYAMVLFLVVITSTSSILSVSSNNDGDQEIFMVVDDPTSMHHAGMGMSKISHMTQEDATEIYVIKEYNVIDECYSRVITNIVKEDLCSFNKPYENNEEIWRTNAVTSGGEMNDDEQVYKSIKPVLSYEKFYHPDGVTLYPEKWTYDGYTLFPFGFPPFASDEKKKRSITEKLKDDLFTGIVQGVSIDSFRYVLDAIIGGFRKQVLIERNRIPIF